MKQAYGKGGSIEMVVNRSTSEKIFDAVNVLFMIILMIITLYPFIYVFFASVSVPSHLVSHRGLLLRPLGFEIGSYKMVFNNPMISTGYLNTLIIVIVGTFINIIMTSIGAYILSRKGFYLKNLYTFLVVFTMFFSGGLIPMYLTVQALHLTDTRLALIIPGAISTWNLIVMRTSFASIPESLEESARIDGANDFTILFKVILPLSLPVVAVMILFYGVAHWNSWFNAMIYLRKRELYPLQLILREILISSSTDSMTTDISGLEKELVSETVKYATIMVATVPILFVYPFLQKYFVKGIMIGAIKG